MMRPYRRISGRDVDGGYASPRYQRVEAALLRRERSDDGLCINSREHGEVTHGVRCKRCFAVHRYGVEVVTERGVDELDLEPRRPGRKPRNTNLLPSAAPAA